MEGQAFSLAALDTRFLSCVQEKKWTSVAVDPDGQPRIVDPVIELIFILSSPIFTQRRPVLQDISKSPSKAFQRSGLGKRLVSDPARRAVSAYAPVSPVLPRMRPRRLF
jgi:hypothetical protein